MGGLWVVFYYQATVTPNFGPKVHQLLAEFRGL